MPTDVNGESYNREEGVYQVAMLLWDPELLSYVKAEVPAEPA